MRRYSGGRKRPSGNVSVREDFLEEESIDQGSDGKELKIGSKEERESSAFGKEEEEERTIPRLGEARGHESDLLGSALGSPCWHKVKSVIIHRGPTFLCDPIVMLTTTPTSEFLIPMSKRVS